MSGSNQKPKSDITTMSSAEYQTIAKSMSLPAPCLKLLARFLVGGLICLIGQCIQRFYVRIRYEHHRSEQSYGRRIDHPLRHSDELRRI